MRKWLIFILFGILLINIARAYTPPPYTSVNLTLTTPYTPPPYTSVNLTLGEVVSNVYTREVSDTITITGITSTQGNLERAISTQAQITESTSRESQVGRKTTNLFSISLLAERISNLFRTTTQALSINEIVERISNLARNFLSQIGIIETTERTYTGTREPTQSISFLGVINKGIGKHLVDTINITDITNRISTLTRPITDSIGITTTTERMVIYSRNLYLEPYITTKLSRQVLYNRYPTLTTFITESSVKELKAGRSVTLTAIVSPELSRLLNLERTNTISIIITPELARQIGISRETELTIVATPELLKNINIQRVSEDTFKINESILKRYATVREISQPFSIQGITERTASLIRAPFDLLGITSITSREYAGSRNIIQQNYIYATTQRGVALSRETTQSISLTGVVERTRSLIRDLSISFTISDIIEKTRLVSRRLTTLINIFLSIFTKKYQYLSPLTLIDPNTISTYKPNEKITIYITLENETGGLVTNYTTLYLTVYYPNGTTLFKDKLMEEYRPGLYKYNFTAPKELGIYYGIIEGQNYKTYIMFEIVPSGPFRYKIEAPDKVAQASNLPVNISIENIGEAPYDIKITYSLIKGNVTYSSAQKIISLDMYEKKEIHEYLNVPATADTGQAIVKLELEYAKNKTLETKDYVNIVASPKGILKPYYTVRFNLTPEKQSLLIKLDNTTYYEGIIHNGETLDLEEGKYTFYFGAKDYKSATITTYVDRDLTIVSKLEPIDRLHQIYTFFMRDYKLIIIILAILLIIVIFYRLYTIGYFERFRS